MASRLGSALSLPNSDPLPCTTATAFAAANSPPSPGAERRRHRSSASPPLLPIGGTRRNMKLMNISLHLALGNCFSLSSKNLFEAFNLILF
ncbi:hypothetical protein MUK42_36341 [Musa troglodytarum]|uniref:Uncharacterized protein n=1 Tax=Musa troglodytarum TaxID=320322 RepID=A0A9E7JD90_9LILI|nr:hypothetical protein MUK42_36341 [Musa troglodytarum]